VHAPPLSAGQGVRDCFSAAEACWTTTDIIESQIQSNKPSTMARLRRIQPQPRAGRPWRSFCDHGVVRLSRGARARGPHRTVRELLCLNLAPSGRFHGSKSRGWACRR
jgi:hypothetical protein